MTKCNLTKQQCSLLCKLTNTSDCSQCNVALISCLISDANSTNVICPVHDQEIVTNCNLSECDYYTQYPNMNNCALVYMSKQGVDSLASVDISILTQIPLKQINTYLRQAMHTLRETLMDSKTNPEMEPSFITITNQLVCANCEKPVLESVALSQNINEDNWVVYCSEECLKKKPPSVVLLEFQCQTHIGDILQWAIRRYSTLGALEQALGMNRKLLGEQLLHYLNIDADHLYDTTQRVRTRNASLVRRTGQRPQWLDDFSKEMQQFLYDIIRSYGNPVINLEDIKSDILQVLSML